jgi:AcrR family transcriptional regulator
MSIANDDRATKWERRYKEALDAAAEAFSENGYLGSSTADIAEKLGIQQGSLYYYLPSKEAALQAICELGVRQFLAQLGDILASDTTSSAKLRAAFENHLAPLKAKPEGDYVRVFLLHRHQLPAGPRQAVATLARRYHNLIERLFTEAVAKGEFRGGLNPELAAHAMLGLCNSVIGARKLPAGQSIDVIIDSYFGILVNGVDKTTSPTPKQKTAANPPKARK